MKPVIENQIEQLQAQIHKLEVRRVKLTEELDAVEKDIASFSGALTISQHYLNELNKEKPSVVEKIDDAAMEAGE